MSQQQADTDTLDPKRLLSVLTAINEGDFSQRLPTGQEGAAGAIAETLNTLLDRLRAVASETNRITREVTVGKFGGQAQIEGLSGTWKEFPTREEVERFLTGAEVEGLRTIPQLLHARVPLRPFRGRRPPLRLLADPDRRRPLRAFLGVGVDHLIARRAEGVTPVPVNIVVDGQAN